MTASSVHRQLQPDEWVVDLDQIDEVCCSHNVHVCTVAVYRCFLPDIMQDDMGVDADALGRIEHVLLVQPGEEEARCILQPVTQHMSVIKRPYVPRARTGNLEALEISQDSFKTSQVQYGLRKARESGMPLNFIFVPAESKILLGFPAGKHEKIRRESEVPEELTFCGGELRYLKEAGDVKHKLSHADPMSVCAQTAMHMTTAERKLCHPSKCTAACCCGLTVICISIQVVANQWHVYVVLKVHASTHVSMTLFIRCSTCTLPACFMLLWTDMQIPFAPTSTVATMAVSGPQHTG